MDRFNRVLWAVVGLLLTATGALGVAAGRGHLNGVDPRSPLLPRWFLDRWHAWGSWAWAGLAVAGLILAWLGWRLLRAELRPGGRRSLPTDLVLEPGDGPETAGETRLNSPALAHATENALERHAAVERALVRLLGDAEHPELRARIDTAGGTDLRAVGEHLGRTVQQLTVTSGLRPDPVDVTVRPGGPAGPRVR
ncbi:hypothetical protein [Actinomadura sp. HBU206391]|uniref:hypothetical protein n=1 Tax=Actinomadura sp. HBU206391 TaxID=2731692 RepID=UPI00164F6C7B|nr:hypothetical protein [Actinomadura sp. HBU206391]MBC6457368.1 hypothetical protein [Actinomadura sp. HBU206391]